MPEIRRDPPKSDFGLDVSPAQRAQLRRVLLQAFQEDEDPFGVMEEIEELIDNALEVLKTFAMITSYLAAIDALNLLGKPTAFSLEFAAIELLYSGLLVLLRNHASENVARMDRYQHVVLSVIQDPKTKPAVKIATLETFLLEFDKQQEQADKIRDTFENLLSQLASFADRLDAFSAQAGGQIDKDIKEIQRKIKDIQEKIERKKKDFDDHHDGPPFSWPEIASAAAIGGMFTKPVASIVATYSAATAVKTGGVIAGSTSAVTLLCIVAPIATAGLITYGIWAAVDASLALAALAEITRLQGELIAAEARLGDAQRKKRDLANVNSTVKASSALVRSAFARLSLMTGVWKAIMIDAQSLLDLMRSGASAQTINELAFLANMFYGQLARALQMVASKASPRPSSEQPAAKVSKTLDSLVDHFRSTEGGTADLIPQCESWPSPSERTPGKPQIGEAGLTSEIEALLRNADLLKDTKSGSDQEKLLGTLFGMGNVKGFTTVGSSSKDFSDKLLKEYGINPSQPFHVPDVQVYMMNRFRSLRPFILRTQYRGIVPGIGTTLAPYFRDGQTFGQIYNFTQWFLHRVPRRIAGGMGYPGFPRPMMPANPAGTDGVVRARVVVPPLVHWRRDYYLRIFMWMMVGYFFPWRAWLKQLRQQIIQSFWAWYYGPVTEHPGPNFGRDEDQNEGGGGGAIGRGGPASGGGFGPIATFASGGGQTTVSSSETERVVTHATEGDTPQAPVLDLTVLVTENNVQASMDALSAQWPNDGVRGAVWRWLGFEEGSGGDLGFWDYYARSSVVGDMTTAEHVHALNLVQLMMVTPDTKIGITDEGLYKVLHALDTAYTTRSNEGQTGIAHACAAANHIDGVPRPLMAMCLQKVILKHENLGSSS